MKNRVLGIAVAGAILGLASFPASQVNLLAAQSKAPGISIGVQRNKKKSSATVSAGGDWARRNVGRKWPPRSTAQIKRDARKARNKA